MKISSLISLVFLTVACASATRTRYVPLGSNGGYAERSLQDGVLGTVFVGNSYTKPDQALLFAHFRGVELCKERGYKITRFRGYEDKTVTQTVQRTSTYNYQNPSNFSSMSNAGFTTGSVNGGGGFGTTSTWNETYQTPAFVVYLSCQNTAYIAGINLKPILAADIKEYVKDKLDAVQVIGLEDSSPNREILQIGDIILKVNGRRLLTVNQFINAVDAASDKSSISANIVRDGLPLTIKFAAVDRTDEMDNIGAQIVKDACQFKDMNFRQPCVDLRNSPRK